MAHWHSAASKRKNSLGRKYWIFSMVIAAATFGTTFALANFRGSTGTAEPVAVSHNLTTLLKERIKYEYIDSLESLPGNG
jgi:hypothetical protein